MSGVAGVYVVQLAEHRDSGGAGESCDDGGEKNYRVAIFHSERDQLCDQTYGNGNNDELDKIEEIELRVCEHCLRLLSSDECARDEHRDRQTQVRKMPREIYQKRRQWNNRLEKIQNKRDRAGNGTKIDKSFFRR